MSSVARRGVRGGRSLWLAHILGRWNQRARQLLMEDCDSGSLIYHGRWNLVGSLISYGDYGLSARCTRLGSFFVGSLSLYGISGQLARRSGMGCSQGWLAMETWDVSCAGSLARYGICMYGARRSGMGCSCFGLAVSKWEVLTLGSLHSSGICKKWLARHLWEVGTGGSLNFYGKSESSARLRLGEVFPRLAFTRWEIGHKGSLRRGGRSHTGARLAMAPGGSLRHR